jgi:hypothetical protein
MSLKPVYTASSRTDASIIQNLLLEAGIESAMRTDDGGGMLPSLDLAEGVAVMVDETLLEEAKAVLDEYKRGATSIEDDHAD